MTRDDALLCQEEIKNFLTENHRGSQALFDAKDGYAIWSRTDLDMVMDKVIRGLTRAVKTAKKPKA